MSTRDDNRARELIARTLDHVRDNIPSASPAQLLALQTQFEQDLHIPVADDAAADRDVTILLADIRGFTAISERLSAAEVVRLLNHFYTHMNAIIYKYGGWIDKYMGDSVMVLFGVPTPGESDPLRAVACAVEMQAAMDAVNSENAAHGLPKLFMGIGINTGRVSTGQVGSELHREYTVIGDGVNLVSRIETHSLRGQVLISEQTFAQVAERVEVSDCTHVRVKGKRDAIALYEVIACQWETTMQVPRREIRAAPRVEVSSPFHYQRLHGKSVLPAIHDAQTKDISYHGVLAVSPEAIEPLTDIKLSLSLSMFGDDKRDIYAKVVSVRPVEGGYGCGIEFTAIDGDSELMIKDFVDRILEGDV